MGCMANRPPTVGMCAMRSTNLPPCNANPMHMIPLPRRVYDALNVLLAVGIIAKEGKKDIVWRGFPGGSGACRVAAAGGSGGSSSGASGASGGGAGGGALVQARAERLRLADVVERKQQQLKV